MSVSSPLVEFDAVERLCAIVAALVRLVELLDPELAELIVPAFLVADAPKRPGLHEVLNDLAAEFAAEDA